MSRNVIPPKLMIDPSTHAEGQKVVLIKGIRGYTGIDLKKAKEISESNSHSVILRRRPDSNPELERNGIENIRRSGTRIIGGGIDPIANHLEEAVRAAMEAGFYDVASEILDVLKGIQA